MLFLVPLICNEIALLLTLVGLGPRYLDLNFMMYFQRRWILEAKSRT